MSYFDLWYDLISRLLVSERVEISTYIIQFISGFFAVLFVVVTFMFIISLFKKILKL